ncbi:MAG: glycosyltransferase family 4 protein [bacterium]|nr:glycosyltransferase family 4 protein [bacterium]
MTEKKKIILIGSVPPPYHGSSIYFSDLLNSKLKNEFEITHLDISDHRDLNNLSKLDFTNAYLAVKNIYNLRKLITNIRPDLIYIPVASNFLPYLRDGLFILTSSYFSKAKIVIHLHEGKYFREGFYKNSSAPVRAFIKSSLKKVDTAIVLSEGLKMVFKDLVRNVVSSPNGIKDEDHVRPASHYTERNLKVSFLGNLFESKGILDVLNAAAIIKSNIEFHFAGGWSDKEGNTKEKAFEIISKNKIDDKVFFHGIVTGEQKKKFLEMTDILVFPTWYKYEGFPLVIIEAMSVGIPVISVGETGTISDIIIDGETGILIDKKNPAMISDAVLKLAGDPELRKNLGDNGRKRFKEYYTHDISINRMIDIFTKTLNNYIYE